MNELLDSVIIGSGPAGITASIYLSRAVIKHAIITGNTIGGNIIDNNSVENYPGFKSISGYDLMSKMMDHAKSYNPIIIFDVVISIEKIDSMFCVNLLSGDIITTKTIIVCSGSKVRKLNLNGEDRLFAHGIYSCVLCDANYAIDKTVVVIGGGNVGVDDAIYLSKMAKYVYIIHRHDKLKADKIVIDKLASIDNINVILNDYVIEILTENDVIYAVKLKYYIDILYVDIIFNATGMIPNTDFLVGLVEMDVAQYIIVDNNFMTSVPGIFAAGDVRDPYYKQAIVSSGYGCSAAISVIDYLNRL